MAYFKYNFNETLNFFIHIQEKWGMPTLRGFFACFAVNFGIVVVFFYPFELFICMCVCEFTASRRFIYPYLQEKLRRD